MWERKAWLLCIDHLCGWQICNDWTIECKEWCVQFWCCPAWASDWEETCWSHFTTWTAESSDMGTNHYLFSWLALILYFQAFETCMFLLLFILADYWVFSCVRLHQNSVRTRLSSVLMQDYKESAHSRQLQRYLLHPSKITLWIK